jgi:hypothetical protein
MPAKETKDRRVQRTEQLLHQALGSLIREKPFDSIVVTGARQRRLIDLLHTFQ